MFYAERMGRGDEPYIAERGIFFSIAEFAPYRKLGWSGTEETDKLTDEYIVEVEGKTE